MSLQIKTNNQWRDLVYGYDVPEKVLQDQFDHLSEDEKIDGFIKYRNYWYHISDFMKTNIDGWHGQHSDSFFSGVLIRFDRHCEQYQIATYYS